MKTIIFENKDLFVIDLKTQYGNNLEGAEFAVVTDLNEDYIRKAYFRRIKSLHPLYCYRNILLRCCWRFRKNKR